MKKWFVSAVVALLAVSAADASGFVRSSFVNVNVGRSRVFVANRAVVVNRGFVVNRSFAFGGYSLGYGAAAFVPAVSYYYQPAALLLPTLPAVPVAPVAPVAPAVPAPAPEVPVPTYAPAVAPVAAPAVLAPLPVLAPATITYLQTVPVFSRRLFLQTHYGTVVGNRLFDRHFGVRVRVR